MRVTTTCLRAPVDGEARGERREARNCGSGSVGESGRVGEWESGRESGRAIESPYSTEHNTYRSTYVYLQYVNTVHSTP